MRGQEGFRYYDKAAKRRTCVFDDGRFEFGRVPNEGCARINLKERSGGSQRAEVIFGRGQAGQGCRVMRDEDPSNTWRNFVEQLKPLAAHRRFANGKTGYMPTWSRKARDESIADRIRNDCENDWDGARLLQQRIGRVRALRKKQVWLQRDEFLRVSLNRLRVGGRKIARLHDDVRPAELLKLIPEDGKARLYLPIVLG